MARIDITPNELVLNSIYVSTHGKGKAVYLDITFNINMPNGKKVGEFSISDDVQTDNVPENIRERLTSLIKELEQMAVQPMYDELKLLPVNSEEGDE